MLCKNPLELADFNLRALWNDFRTLDWVGVRENFALDIGKIEILVI